MGKRLSITSIITLCAAHPEVCCSTENRSTKPLISHRVDGLHVTGKKEFDELENSTKGISWATFASSRPDTSISMISHRSAESRRNRLLRLLASVTASEHESVFFGILISFPTTEARD